MDPMKSDSQLPELVRNLLSYDETRHKNALDTYFVEDARLSHPLLTIDGTHNIRKVFRVWTSLNAQAPDIDNIVFDGLGGSGINQEYTAVVHLTQNLRPRVMPILHLRIPAVTTLKFKLLEGGLFVVKQEDSWTLEGLIQSVPLVRWWYENVVRVVMGKVFTNAGAFIYSANQATAQLRTRAIEVTDRSREIARPYSSRAQEFAAPYTAIARDYQEKANEYVTASQAAVGAVVSPTFERAQTFVGDAKSFMITAQDKVVTGITKMSRTGSVEAAPQLQH